VAKLADEAGWPAKLAAKWVTKFVAKSGVVQYTDDRLEDVLDLAPGPPPVDGACPRPGDLATDPVGAEREEMPEMHRSTRRR